MEDISGLRIVEISQWPHLKQALPDQVVYFSTSTDHFPADRADDGTSIASLPNLRALWRVLHEPETSLVVCRTTVLSPLSWRWLVRVLFHRRTLQRIAFYPRALGPQLLRRRVPPPVVIWDDADMPLINRNNFFLLDRCRIYFKRELPPDRWRLFMKVGHANLPPKRFRMSARYGARIDKLRPISIGLTHDVLRLQPGLVEKSTDVFFAGTIDGSSSVRKKGLPELLALRERGFVIDVADRPLPQAEFLRRCAQARLTWSPEGHGWECFRHYEAALCASVPVINQPTIERYQPLMQGEHAILYDVEEGGLTRALLAALADKPRLGVMGRAARAHVLAHHTPEAIGRYIVRTALAQTAGMPKIEDAPPLVSG